MWMSSLRKGCLARWCNWRGTSPSIHQSHSGCSGIRPSRPLLFTTKLLIIREYEEREEIHLAGGALASILQAVCSIPYYKKLQVGYPRTYPYPCTIYFGAVILERTAYLVAFPPHQRVRIQSWFLLSIRRARCYNFHPTSIPIWNSTRLTRNRDFHLGAHSSLWRCFSIVVCR